MVAYVLAGYLLQDTMPSLLLFFLLALSILFPLQLLIIFIASKKEYGSYSLRSAFSTYQKLNWWKIVLYGVLLWGFAGIMTVTIAPLENMLFSPISERLSAIIPPYFDWTNIEYLQQYSSNILLLTCAMYLILNGLIGPIVEELFFRGYLTAKISRFGKYAPFIVTVLFSLYHFWSPFNNLFRIIAFYPAFYLAWRMKNIYIAIVVHVLGNLTSSIGFIVAVSSFL
jgi:membrane protease YdiL (CAAX protease family)